MLSHSNSVERRTVLEAKTLRKMGCNVLLLCRTLDDRPLVEMTDGLLVIHLPGKTRCKIPSAVLPMQEWIAKAISLIPLEAHCVPPGTRISPPTYLQREPVDIPSDIFKVHFDVYPLNLWEAQVVELALAIGDIDVVHMHDFEALRPGIFVAKRLGIPTVFDVHEIWAYIPLFHDKIQNRAHIFNLEALFIPHCTQLVTVNKQFAEIIKRDYNYDRIGIFTNTTERPSGFDVRKRYDYIRTRVPIPHEHKIMLFVGNVSPLCNIDPLLIGMATARPDLDMVFLTAGVYVPLYRELAAQLGIGNRVHFLDIVPWSEIPLWCASADVGVMPYQAISTSMRLSSPNNMYDFIAAATPIIGSSELVNVAEIVGGEGFGLLAPLRLPADYMKLINDMFDESLGGPERFHKAMVEKGDKYLLDQEIRPFTTMYRTLLNSLNVELALQQSRT